MPLTVYASLMALLLASDGTRGLSEHEARLMFAEYAERSHASDPQEADLYCDNGRIVLDRESAEGTVTTVRGMR